jgi:type VI secretion system secreted protein VgrG
MVVKRKYTQKNRRISITTPLGEDKLLLRSITGSEAISQPFQYHLELLSEDDAIDFKCIVGQRVTVKLLLADASPRYFNGFISRFSQGARDGVLTSYHAEMVPWLWFLTRTADCRIFQKKSVPDIIQQIFKDLGFTDFKLNLYSTFQPRDYCVQYRETDFHFVSRLMEQVGIYYFFEHDDTKHNLILGNDPNVHKDCPGQPKVRYELTAGGWQDDDVITEWRLEEAFRPGSWAQTDYNFETPSTSLLVALSGANKYEIYDYPGDYAARGDGDTLTKVRLEEDTTPTLVAQGTSDCRAFVTGHKFTLQDHYRPDLNQPYVITSVNHRASQGGDYGGGAMDGLDKEFTYQNTFACIPASVTFRPGRITPRPTVRGCQTAMVVGPGGEEIHTDKYGRVKVQFHWDREGKRNENSSCWVRVSHPWAGKGWGAVSIPRIGQEVVVDFLEGDPDQPIIVGRVYNAESMPPYGLPAGAVVSGVKSNSTKGGGGYNEIVMDDTKGTELIRVHAQYDKDKVVEHDERVHVKHDRTEAVDNDETITIGHDRKEEVKHDEKIRIGNDKTEVVNHDRTLQVDHDKTETVVHNKRIQVGGDHSENIDGAMTVIIGSTLTENVLVNYAESVAGAMEITVGAALAITAGGAMAETVGAIKAETVGGNKTENIGGNKTFLVGKDLTETVTGNFKRKVDKDVMQQVTGKQRIEVTKECMVTAKKIQITADDEIHLKTGSAEILLKKNGDITMNGKKITVKGSGDVIVKGSKIKEN